MGEEPKKSSGKGLLVTITAILFLIKNISSYILLFIIIFYLFSLLAFIKCGSILIKKMITKIINDINKGEQGKTNNKDKTTKKEINNKNNTRKRTRKKSKNNPPRKRKIKFDSPLNCSCLPLNLL